MTYATLDSVNTTQGIHTVFIYVNDITSGLFARLILFSFFIVLSLGSYLTIKRTSQNADLPASLAMAGFITSGAAIIMSFIPGIINTFDIVVTFTATFLFVLWLFMSKKKE